MSTYQQELKDYMMQLQAIDFPPMLAAMAILERGRELILMENEKPCSPVKGGKPRPEGCTRQHEQDQRI